MGGAGFPTRVKIEPNPAMPKTILRADAASVSQF